VFQAQEEAGEVPWPFSCEVVVGRFSKRDEHALEEGEELQVAVDPQAAQAVLRPVARGRHTERDRVSYERDSIRRWPRGVKGHVPVWIELSAWSVLGTQGEQGTQLAVVLSE
jgi:hypothetical protein